MDDQPEQMRRFAGLISAYCPLGQTRSAKRPQSSELDMSQMTAGDCVLPVEAPVKWDGPEDWAEQ